MVTIEIYGYVCITIKVHQKGERQVPSFSLGGQNLSDLVLGSQRCSFHSIIYPTELRHADSTHCGRGVVPPQAADMFCKFSNDRLGFDQSVSSKNSANEVNCPGNSFSSTVISVVSVDCL